MHSLTINRFWSAYKKQESCEQLVEMSRNSDYATGKLLDYLYHYKHIGINLSKQTNMPIPK